ncbi:MAG: hypothetical protein LBP86_08465 [Azoarcus sp.]|nr:hypothetical protein [Azoarcus sp.]
MAAKMYCDNLRAADSGLPLAERAALAVDGFLAALAALCLVRETGPDRARWSLAATTGMNEIVAALQAADRDAPDEIPATVLARAAAEAIRWNFVDRQAPDAVLWRWLGGLFVGEREEGEARVTGENGTVACEYLRAIAYHAAALDQLPLKTGFAVARLIDLLLPFLLLMHEDTQAALYVVDVAQRGIPVRLAWSFLSGGWCFVTVPAADMLSDVHDNFTHGQLPPGLRGLDSEVLHAAVVHLRRQWSAYPPVRRYRRYPLDVRLSIVRGYNEAMDLLACDVEEGVAAGAGAWWITDLSRGGVGALTLRNARNSAPASGDLVAFCPEEGTKWHIGVVRRVRTSKSYIEIGIATLSQSPDLVRVDDGRASRELCFCDPVRRGDAVRLLGPVGALGDGVPLFVMLDGRAHKLRPLADALRGRSFDLRVYRIS